jgi:hypothetical protein
MKSTYLDAFIRNKIAGNYHAVRCRALLDQINSKQFGLWNGIMYTEECLSAEYWLAKHAAIKAFAGAQVAEIELVKLGVSILEIREHFKKFQDSQIFRDDKDYSEFMDDCDDKTAHFVEGDDGGPPIA